MKSVVLFIARLWLFLLFGAIFLVLLAIGMVVMLVAMVWVLITGRRPSAAVLFNKVVRTSQTFSGTTGSFNRGRSQATPSDVVDVQAREVRNALEDDRSAPPKEPE